jgi:predicted enzyme related to lactoylglutathione lyase
MADLPIPETGLLLTHFIVSDDVQRSRRFYTEVLGGETLMDGEPAGTPAVVQLANSWIVINSGGGPTDDKPAVTLRAPSDTDNVSGFLNIRVADIHSVYKEWGARGATFLTEPIEHETEIRCYLRDPDGRLIEVGQATFSPGPKATQKFVVQVYFNGGQGRLQQLPEAERNAISDEYGAFFASPEVKDGNQLQPPATATTVRLEDGELVRTTGPNAKTDEPLGGYYLIEAADIDAATAIAARIPALRLGGTIEIRPVITR